MARYEKEILQAVLIAETNVRNLKPFSDENTTALLPLVNITMLDYALSALNRSGVEQTFVYASVHVQKIRDHIKKGIASNASWSLNMFVEIIGGDGCRCFGDAMRDLDAKALIRGSFILMGADTVTNQDLRSAMKAHKRTVQFDKGAAATLLFKNCNSETVRTGNELIIAVDVRNGRLHHQQRLRMNSKETHHKLPLSVLTQNSCVSICYNVLDPQIAIGSPSMLSLFSDNFDFQTRDDFVRGVLINEELLDSRLYVSFLESGKYARKVNNWLSYQLVSRDIINRWVYPLVPDMDVHGFKQQYVVLKDNIYKSNDAHVPKVALRQNVVVQSDCHVDTGTSISNSVIGAHCRIGKNCELNNAFLMENVIIHDNCKLSYCFIGAGSVVHENCSIHEGSVLGNNCALPANTQLANTLLTSTPDTQQTEDGQSVKLEELGKQAFVISDYATGEQDSSDNEELLPDQRLCIPKMGVSAGQLEESDYNSSSDEDESRVATPLPDDTNIFLFEVIDSLSRGLREKSNPDFLILEINSSRYAYNMSLKEVNFNVVKAVFGMPNIREPSNGNVLQAINAVFKQLGPVVSNYIKSEDAMLDCLKALEDVCEENELVRAKVSQVVHYLYDKDFVSESSIRSWYTNLNPKEHEHLKQSLAKLIDWLDQSSEEDDDGADDDEEEED